MSFFFFSGLASSDLGLSLVVISLSSVTTCPSVFLVLFVAMSLISDSSRDPHKPPIELDTVSVNLKTPNHTKSLFFQPQRQSAVWNRRRHTKTLRSAVSNWDRIVCHDSQFKYFFKKNFNRTISQLLNYVFRQCFGVFTIVIPLKMNAYKHTRTLI